MRKFDEHIQSIYQSGAFTIGLSKESFVHNMAVFMLHHER